MTKFYKVVYNKNGKLLSAYLNEDVSSGRYDYDRKQLKYIKKTQVYYKVGKWVKPKLRGTKLFVFDSLEKARRWKNDGYKMTIYECEIINGDTNYDWFYGHYFFSFIKSRILKKRRPENYVMANAIPDGTLFVDAVKLIREVS